MASNGRSTVSRRFFVQRSGLMAGGLLLGGSVAGRVVGSCSAKGQAPTTVTSSSTVTARLPRRVLGRTQESLTTMTLGTAPCGLSPKIPPREIAKIVNIAIDLGINSIDTAPSYLQSEEGIGLALGTRRKEVFLATKVLADSEKAAEKSLAQSFKLTKTDQFDLVYFHSVGDHDSERARQAGGVFNWLVKQKQAGKFRFLGISGHHRPLRFLPLLETGAVDVLLTVINFVDRYTYNFEEKVLPTARKHNVGIVAMKVFGGARQSAYEDPHTPPELDVKHLENAVRYSLGVPGVCSVNLGVHNSDQLRENVKIVTQYQALTPQQQQALAGTGRQLARDWTDHFGPVS